MSEAGVPRFTRISEDEAAEINDPSEFGLVYRLKEDEKTFGIEYLRDIHLARISTPDSRKLQHGSEDFTAIRASILGRARADLKETFSNPSRSRYVSRFYDEANADKKVNRKITRNADAHLSPDETMVRILYGPKPTELFNSDVVTDDILEQMLQQHIAGIEKRRVEFEKKVPDFLTAFRSRIEAFQNKTGVDVNLNRLDSEKDVAKILLVDPLSSAAKGIRGDFDIQHGFVNIVSSLEEDYDETFTHEMLHFLSGRAMLKETKESIFGELAQVVHQKRGASFDGNITRFFWLNEAETSHITEKLLNKPATGYTDEQELVDLLLDRGKATIDRKLLHAAYFENFATDAPPGKKLPAWKAFRSAVNEVYSSTFLVKLDEFVIKNGTKEAVRVMRTDWHQIDSIKENLEDFDDE
jgi:hypothetical protein